MKISQVIFQIQKAKICQKKNTFGFPGGKFSGILVLSILILHVIDLLAMWLKSLSFIKKLINFFFLKNYPKE
jgi:hypothetical protein